MQFADRKVYIFNKLFTGFLILNYYIFFEEMVQFQLYMTMLSSKVFIRI